MDKKDKWIEDAFKDALPRIEGMTIEQFADKVQELFVKRFPSIMSAYTFSFGEDKAFKFAMMMLKDDDIITLLRCFFGAGYREGKAEGEKPKEE